MSMSILCCTNKCFYFVLLGTLSITFPTLSRNLSSRLTPSITNCFINSYVFSSSSFNVVFSSLSFWFSYITSISLSLTSSVPPCQDISYTLSAIFVLSISSLSLEQNSSRLFFLSVIISSYFAYSVSAALILLLTVSSLSSSAAITFRFLL